MRPIKFLYDLASGQISIEFHNQFLLMYLRQGERRGCFVLNICFSKVAVYCFWKSCTNTCEGLSTGTLSIKGWVQDVRPQTMAPWHTGYFKRREFEEKKHQKQKVLSDLLQPFSHEAGQKPLP